jgi:hypothetical protein
MEEVEEELLQGVDLTNMHPLILDLLAGLIEPLTVLIQQHDEVITYYKQQGEKGENVKGRLETIRRFLETTNTVLNNGIKIIKKLEDKTIIAELPYGDRASAAGGKRNKTRKRKYKKHKH